VHLRTFTVEHGLTVTGTVEQQPHRRHRAATNHSTLTSIGRVPSGMGPVDGHERLRADSKADNAFWWLVRQAPWLLKPLCGLTASMTLTAARGDPAKARQRLQRTTSGPDRRTLAALLANADMLPAFLEDLRESYRQKARAWPATWSATATRGGSA
jgi:hypothetical protein